MRVAVVNQVSPEVAGGALPLAVQGARQDRGQHRNQDGRQPAVPRPVGGGVIGRCDGTLDPGARGGEGAGHVGLLSEPAKGPEQASWEGYTTRGATEAI